MGKAVELEPTSPETIAYLANAQFRAGLVEQSIESYKQALKIEPSAR